MGEIERKHTVCVELTYDEVLMLRLNCRANIAFIKIAPECEKKASAISMNHKLLDASANILDSADREIIGEAQDAIKRMTANGDAQDILNKVTENFIKNSNPPWGK